MSWNVRNHLNHPRAHCIAVKESDNTMKKRRQTYIIMLIQIDVLVNLITFIKIVVTI